MMTLTLNLPEDLAARLAETLPEAERDQFALSAIADALTTRQQEAEARLEQSLMADFDPEREAAECRAAVEEGLDDVDAGRDLLSIGEAQRRWETGRIERRAANPA